MTAAILPNRGRRADSAYRTTLTFIFMPSAWWIVHTTVKEPVLR